MREIIEIEVNVFVHGKFYKRILHKLEYDYVTIYAHTPPRRFVTMPMRKEFHAAIRGTEQGGFTADFGDTELVWEGDNLIFKQGAA